MAGTLDLSRDEKAKLRLPGWLSDERKVGVAKVRVNDDSYLFKVTICDLKLVG